MCWDVFIMFIQKPGKTKINTQKKLNRLWKNHFILDDYSCVFVNSSYHSHFKKLGSLASHLNKHACPKCSFIYDDDARFVIDFFFFSFLCMFISYQFHRINKYPPLVFQMISKTMNTDVWLSSSCMPFLNVQMQMSYILLKVNEIDASPYNCQWIKWK